MTMRLPVMPPVSPMLAKSVPAIPPDASYEPKWDGFRSICFRDGDEVEFGLHDRAAAVAADVRLEVRRHQLEALRAQVVRGHTLAAPPEVDVRRGRRSLRGEARTRLR